MKKNNQSKIVSAGKMPLYESLDDNQYLQWIVRNGLTLIFTVFGLIFLFVVVYKSAFSTMLKSEYDFINAENAYTQIAASTSGGQTQENLDKLNIILKKHPELQAKYDAKVAQILIGQGDSSQALPFGALAVQRTEVENTPFYSEYAKTTLLIAEKKYEEALTQALTMKTKLLEYVADVQKTSTNPSSIDLLFAFNLLRIGALQGELSLKQEELKTWNEWKRYASLDKKLLSETHIDGFVFQKLTDNLQDGKASFLDYLEMREKDLK